MATLKKRLVYIGGPFFTPEQLQQIKALEDIFDKQKIDYFSPRKLTWNEHFSKGLSLFVRKFIFTEDIRQLELCTDMIVVKTGGDLGTLFEFGYSLHRAFDREDKFTFANIHMINNGVAVEFDVAEEMRNCEFNKMVVTVDEKNYMPGIIALGYNYRVYRNHPARLAFISPRMSKSNLMLTTIADQYKTIEDYENHNKVIYSDSEIM